MRSLAPRSLPVCRFAATTLALSSCATACGHDTQPARAPVATQATNLVTNGDFSSGLEPWGAHTAGGASAGHPLQPRVIDGSLCTPVTGGEEVIVGWPVAGSSAYFALSAGKQYELALKVSGTGPLPLECVIKVGHQVAPYTGAFTTRLPLGPTLAPFRAAFAPDHDDDRAGIAVECRGAPGSAQADVCIDDVSLSLAAL
jgi:endoglucanase